MIITKKEEVTIIEVESTTLTSANAKEFKLNLEKEIENETHILLCLLYTSDAADE